MELAQVTGSVVASLKDPHLTGRKLLLVRPLAPDGALADGLTTVAVDTVGAGVGEQVVVTRGTPATRAEGLHDAPVDAAIVAIIDRVDVDPQNGGG